MLSTTAIQSITFDDKNVRRIGKYAFRGCSSSGKVELPDSIGTIGQGKDISGKTGAYGIEWQIIQIEVTRSDTEEVENP